MVGSAGLRWFEQLGVAGSIATFVGFLATFAGLYYAWRQADQAAQSAKSAATAAETARDAVIETAHTISVHQLMVLVPLLAKVADDLDTALEAGDSSWSNRHLNSWRQQASHINGLLPKGSGDQDMSDLAKQIQQSVQLASVAADALRKERIRANQVLGSGKPPKAERPPVETCDEVRKSMAIVCDRMSLYVADQSVTL